MLLFVFLTIIVRISLSETKNLPDNDNNSTAVLISKYAKVAHWGSVLTTSTEVPISEGRSNNGFWVQSRSDNNLKTVKPSVVYHYPVQYNKPSRLIQDQPNENLPAAGEVLERFNPKPYFNYDQIPPSKTKPQPTVDSGKTSPPQATPTFDSFPVFKKPPDLSSKPVGELYSSGFSSYNPPPPDSTKNDMDSDVAYPPNAPLPPDSSQDSYAAPPSTPDSDGPYYYKPPKDEDKKHSIMSSPNKPPSMSYLPNAPPDSDNNRPFYSYTPPKDDDKHPMMPMQTMDTTLGPPLAPPGDHPDYPINDDEHPSPPIKDNSPPDHKPTKEEEHLYYPPKSNMMKDEEQLYYPPSDDGKHKEVILDHPPPGYEEQKPNMMPEKPADMAEHDLAPPPPAAPPDYNFPQYLYNGPHDFDHHHEIYHEVNPPTTTTTQAPEDERVNKGHYSYYYLGRKLYYIPLYFSVYFVIYVAVLILKSIARHKIQFKDHFDHYRSARMMTDNNNDRIEDVHENVTQALDLGKRKFSLVTM